ncbi:MAG: zinc metalloprotease HtpX [Gemmatimonadota bacterium]|jgi:heat shock protein HtpX
MTSYVKTFGLMALLTALFVGLAGWFGGRDAMLPAFLIAALFNGVTFWFSDRLVLRMYRAKELSREDAPEVWEMVDRLRSRAGLPMPKLAITPSRQPNAFATGRSPDHAAVCFTTGILETLDRAELEGVIAHELAHVRNRDMLIGTVAATLSAAIVFLARMAFWFGGDRDRGGLVGGILMLILAPIAAGLIQMAISRSGEFRADRVGAEIAGNPLGLASALRQLEAGAARTPLNVTPAAAHLCIVNPLRGGGTAFASLFRTHPPTEERVRRLEEMAGAGA